MRLTNNKMFSYLSPCQALYINTTPTTNKTGGNNMKTCVIQPAYCLDFSRSDEFLEWEINELDKCDPSMDVIVLPEYSNVPCLAKTKCETLSKRS